MLSRSLRRVALDSRWSLPPTFLCPWTANLTTEAHSAATASSPPPIGITSSEPSPTIQPTTHTKIYITAHIHAHGFLVTQGDTIRLPFLLRGVEPGDVLRLNRAVNLGSRDFTLRAPAKERRGKSDTAATEVVEESVPAKTPLFVCRAVVMGVEAEPMRVLEKTKRRQRHVKHVKSKHKYTVLKIKELRVRSLEEIESGKVEEIVGN
ncbi:hypothetical protein ANO11243_089570 [Dothideomycetidae sp. 11243]|nr:hypothetical protein ANO11243_089570 [fungal sp. No.11243]